MNAPNDNTASKGFRAWWKSPPRSGLQLIIAPWEYRHLRGFASVRIAGGALLICLSVVTLAFGGNDSKSYGWAFGFFAAGVAHLSFASWELRIARAAAARP